MRTFNLRGLFLLFPFILIGCQEDDCISCQDGNEWLIKMPESWDSMNGEYDGHLAIFYRDDSSVQEDIIFSIEKENNEITLTFLQSKHIKIPSLIFRIREIDRTINDNGYIYFDSVENQFFKSYDKYGEYTNRFNIIIDPAVTFASEPRITMRLKLISLTNNNIRQVSIDGTRYL